MSVTESKSKKVKKASPKASTRKADAQSDVPVAVLDSALSVTPHGPRLFIGDLNCRLIPHTPEEIRVMPTVFSRSGKSTTSWSWECDDGRLEIGMRRWAYQSHRFAG